MLELNFDNWSRKPGDMERFHGEEMGSRSDAFRRATQRTGMPMTYGTGDPEKSGIDQVKLARHEAAARKRAAGG